LSMSSMIKKANDLYRRGFYLEALNIYKQLTKLHPKADWIKLNSVMAMIKSRNFGEAFRLLDNFKYSQNIPSKIIITYQNFLRKTIYKHPYHIWQVNSPYQYHQSVPKKKIIPPLRKINDKEKFPAGFPFEMVLPPLLGNNNDFDFILDAAQQTAFNCQRPSLKIRVIAWIENYDEENLLIKNMKKQTYPLELIKLSIFSDSYRAKDNIKFNFDRILNSPWKLSKNEQFSKFSTGSDIILFLSGSVEMDPTTLERLARYFSISSNSVIPLVSTKDFSKNYSSLTHFSKIYYDVWKKDRLPYRRICTFNFGITSKRFYEIGGLDNRFLGPEFCVKEFCFRAYNLGSYFFPLPISHLDISKFKTIHSIEDKKLFIDLCPIPWDRSNDGTFEIPKVSVYIPSYNSEKFIDEAIDSVLTQDFEDLEVCIAIDGSTDKTLDILERRYNSNPRVRWISNPNGGIGFSSNSAISFSNGIYIAQLDSDDRLKPGSIKRLAKYLDEHLDVGCVYSSCERIDANGNYVCKEYNYPQFNRKKMLITSIVHHFRMFRRQSWERTEKFREDLVNAVDYDMFLKLCEVTNFFHIDEIQYERRWHGENTSNINENLQTKNTYIAQRNALNRQGLDSLWDVHVPDTHYPRKVTYKRKSTHIVFFWPDYSNSNPYQRLLYSTSNRNTDYISGNIDAAINALKRAHKPSNIVFHLHWLNKIFKQVNSPKDASNTASLFLEKLKKFKWLKGKIIWTIHNTISHDSKWPDVELELSSEITKIADCLHIHSLNSVREINRFFHIPNEKIRISRHGNYVGFYPNFISSETARKILGIQSDSNVILFLGQIRPYKGLDLLVKAFNNILKKWPNSILLIAGKAQENIFEDIPELKSILKNKSIRFFNRFIDDMELQLFFKSSDFAVFPYHCVLTSGSLILSLGFGVPVITPNVGMTNDVINRSNAGILYNGKNGLVSLENSITAMLENKTKGYLKVMSDAALRVSQSLTWDDFSHILTEL